MNSRKQEKQVHIISRGILILYFGLVLGTVDVWAESSTFISKSDLSTETLNVPCLEYEGSYLNTDFQLISWNPVQLQLVIYGENSLACKSLEGNYNYTADGTYSYSSQSGSLELDIGSSEFLYNCGPIAGLKSLTVQTITPTVMAIINEDAEQEIWIRESGNTGDPRGTWKYTSENGNTYILQLGANGVLSVSGNVGFCGDDSLTGIYGRGFEFELEDIHPLTPDTYHVGSSLEAVDFSNSITPFNLHAYGGSITITSVSPLFTGTFSLNSFAMGHGQIPSLSGNISGSFSIPYDGSPGGTFQVNGNVGQYIININETDVRLFR